MDQQLLQYVVPGIIIVIVLAFRLRGMKRARPLAVDRLLLFPVLLVGIALFTIVAHPPGALGLALCLAALVVGALIGWQRGKLVRITHDPATGGLVQQSSPAALLLLVGIIVIRFVARAYFVGTPTADAAGGMDPRTLMITDIMLAFAVGLLGMTRVELYLRAKRILAAAPQPLSGDPA